MEKVKSLLLDVVVGGWFIVAVFVTVCLLSYNEFKVTTFGKYSFIIMDSDELEPEYLEGDLLIVKRNSDNKIAKGDDIFYYNAQMNSSIMIFNDKVQEKEETSKTDTTYILNDKKVSGEYVIGKKDTAKSYHKLGAALGLLTSKWGFMFLVIFPTLFAIIYEIMMIVESLKKKRLYEE